MKTEEVFTCPQCGKHKLEEVMIGVIQTTVIDAVEATPEGVVYDYGDYSHDGGEVAHYQCGHCGKIVAEDEDKLAELLGLKRKVRFYHIVWDTSSAVDGECVDLPTDVILEVNSDTDLSLEGANVLSDKYGWCVWSFDFSILG